MRCERTLRIKQLSDIGVTIMIRGAMNLQNFFLRVAIKWTGGTYVGRARHGILYSSYLYSLSSDASLDLNLPRY